MCIRDRKKPTSKKKKKANSADTIKIRGKKDIQTKKKISKKVKLSEEKESDNYSEQAKSKSDEVIEIAPLKEIANKKSGWWSK